MAQEHIVVPKEQYERLLKNYKSIKKHSDDDEIPLPDTETVKEKMDINGADSSNRNDVKAITELNDTALEKKKPTLDTHNSSNARERDDIVNPAITVNDSPIPGIPIDTTLTKKKKKKKKTKIVQLKRVEIANTNIKKRRTDSNNIKKKQLSDRWIAVSSKKGIKI
jgi:hypothetical protein